MLAGRIRESGGWMRFDDFMRAALYEPGLGYYSGAAPKLGRRPEDGSDFVTAPELSSLFAQTLARQVAEVTRWSAPAVLEFGAGTGRLAADLLNALGEACQHYYIVEVSGGLRAVQQQTLETAAPSQLHKVQWLDRLPDTFEGCIVGNEVLDAMPVRVVERGPQGWQEVGVALAPGDSPSHEAGNRAAIAAAERFGWAVAPPDDAVDTLVQSRLGDLEPARDEGGQSGWPVGYRTEVAEEAPAMIATLAGFLAKGAAIFIDYGFPAAEYYHPQRGGGTLMCHQGHRSDPDPLTDVGAKDITAHVDFTAIALAGQDAGLDVAGYTSQARFLLNCGLLELMHDADWKTRASAQTLIAEHEMGELFKVIAFTRGEPAGQAGLMGFVAGDRRHTL